MEVLPYKNSSDNKKKQVAEMFNNISGKYDFLNHFLSLGIDKNWRKKAIKILAKENPKTILDVATGTGDFALASMKLNPEKIVGIDIAEKMVEKGIEKVKAKGLSEIIQLKVGDSESIPYENETFDATTVAFGVRNFENLELGLTEMNRILKPNGTAVILEFSKPQKFPVKQLYGFYFKYILPFWGRIISGDKVAYTYLPDSVNAFPQGNDFIEILKKVGFKSAYDKRLFFGVASIYVAKK